MDTTTNSQLSDFFKSKQRSYCEMIVKFHDNYENHLVQGYLIAAVSVMEAILLIVNIVFALS